LLTWAYPVVDVVANPVCPVQQVRVRVDVTAQQALRIANWGLTDAINQYRSRTQDSLRRGRRQWNSRNPVLIRIITTNVIKYP